MKEPQTIWTHGVYLVLDPASEAEEATLLKIGAAQLSRGNLFVELAPGLAVSGRIELKLVEDHP